MIAIAFVLPVFVRLAEWTTRKQAATEVSLMQLAARGLPRRRRKYRNHENRLKTIKEKHEAGDYMLQRTS